MVPIWSMCLFLVISREHLQPSECILYYLYSKYLCIFILHEMYLWNIFNNLVTFNYGMCKVPWFSYDMETCTCHKSVNNAICSLEHLLYEAYLILKGEHYVLWMSSNRLVKDIADVTRLSSFPATYLPLWYQRMRILLHTLSSTNISRKPDSNTSISNNCTFVNKLFVIVVNNCCPW